MGYKSRLQEPKPNPDLPPDIKCYLCEEPVEYLWVTKNNKAWHFECIEKVDPKTLVYNRKSKSGQMRLFEVDNE